MASTRKIPRNALAGIISASDKGNHSNFPQALNLKSECL